MVPDTGALPIDGFKTGLIAGRGNERASPQAEVTKAEAATAFLALILAYALGWYIDSRPLGAEGGSHFLTINVGIPVAARDEKALHLQFEQIVGAAARLAPQALNMTLADVRTAVNEQPSAPPPGYGLVAELTAAIAGYAWQDMVQFGAHVLVDVGASTLDLVAFNLRDRTRASVFTADVDLLGAAAVAVAYRHGIDARLFKTACDSLYKSVVLKGMKPERARNLFHPSVRLQPVQLLATGGGCATEVHSLFIQEMIGADVLGDLPLITPLPPERIAPRRVRSLSPAPCLWSHAR